MADRTVSVRLRAEVSSYMQGMRQAGTAAGQLRTELAGLSRNQGALEDIATAAGGVGLVMAGVAGYAIKMGMDFDKAMSATSAATHAGAQDMEALRQAALAAGQATSFSATQAAQAETELAKAGVSVRDILGGGLSGALALAAAGQMDVGQAAETAATAMTQFGLAGRDIPHIADLLAAGAGNAQGEVSDMAAALKQSGLVANQFGLSIEETTGSLAAFASAGLLGSDAGTSLKTMLLMLANPSAQARDTMASLGIAAYDAGGRFVGLQSLAGQLQSSMAGLTQQQRDQALATIFGSDAIRAANVLYQQGASGISGWTDKVNQAGAASDAARRKTDNLAGDLERLRGSIETLAISSGSGASGGLRALVQMADNLVQAFAGIPGPVMAGGVAIAGIAGSFLLATAAAARLQAASTAALASLSTAGPIAARFATGMQTAVGAAGKLAAGLMAVQLASAAIGDSASPQISKFSKDLAEFGKTGKTSGEAAKSFGKDMENLKFDLSTFNGGIATDVGNGVAGFVEGLTGLGSVMDQSLQHAHERIAGLDQALAGMVASGKADEAAAAFERLKKIGAEQGISTRELTEALPQYAAALDMARDSTTKSGAATTQATQATRDLSTGLADAVRQAGGFKQAWEQLRGTLVGGLEATIAAEAAIDGLAEALSRNGNNFNIDTAAGRENSTALLSVITAARDAAQAKYEETGSVEAAQAVYAGYLQRMRETAGGNAALRAEVDRLIATYGQLPPLKETRVSAPGLGESLSGLQAYADQLNAIPRSVTSRITYSVTQNGDLRAVGPGFSGYSTRRWGGVTEYAALGTLRDPMIYRAGASPLYGFAEPSTGGEAFIPRKGDLARSRRILEHVATSWLGGSVSWGQQPQAAAIIAPTINMVVNAGIGADATQISAAARAAIVDVLASHQRSNR